MVVGVVHVCPRCGATCIINRKNSRESLNTENLIQDLSEYFSSETVELSFLRHCMAMPVHLVPQSFCF